jgi:hypothetical protein
MRFDVRAVTNALSQQPLLVKPFDKGNVLVVPAKLNSVMGIERGADSGGDVERRWRTLQLVAPVFSAVGAGSATGRT